MQVCALLALVLLAPAVQQKPANTVTRQQAMEDPELLDKVPAPAGPLYRILEKKRLSCFSDFAPLDRSSILTMAGRKFVFDGISLVSMDADRDGKVVIGVLGALKDFEPETRKALEWYIERFRQANVDAVILNGDLASSEFEMISQILAVATGEWLVLALSGNTESRAAFNRAILQAMKLAPEVVNLNIIPRVDLGGLVVLAQCGYHDRRFVHRSAGCVYDRKQLQKLAGLATRSPTTKFVFVSHGPPRRKGPNTIDRAVEGGNVGDPALARFIEETGIPFGIFSHILEAGGRADDGSGHAVEQGRWSKRLYVNIGSANPLAWQLNDGTVSCGMAAVFEFRNGLGRYRLLRRKCER